ncbi:hypothetical protein BV210_12650 [Halorientalis sp. IM1011]|uniref:hypothetical protein n=1 Tax=Halorientalis sp. IM1011 TaxID=1932360 RepID=UPI00097CD23F|nr:hypothetical protein [Halorientalis sp. IM1011]AQL43490.1 hypothetical protein BV210_12650 [Halorientalis sp. IM1011]
MKTRGTLLAVVLVAAAVGLVAVPVLGAVDGTTPASDGMSAVQANDSNETATSEVSLGAQISSFMQSNSAETESSVEAGMWAAEYNRSAGDERPAVVESRIDRLERRSERLRERMSRLQSKYENDTIPAVAYRAQASRLTAELNGLDEAINETSDRARAVGVNTSRLDSLRDRTQNMSGQEVAAVARELGVGPPDHAGPPGERGPGNAGPPGDVGPSTNVTNDDRRGPPGDRRPGGPGQGETGPSENVTNDQRQGPLPDADDPPGPRGPAAPNNPSDPSDPADTDNSTDADDSDDGLSGGPSGSSGGGSGDGPPGR